MKLHRFIGNFDPDDKVSGPRPERRGIKIGRFKLKDSELLNQFRNVLKLKIGERVVLCDGKMNEGTAEIKGYGKDTIDIEILDICKNQNEPERKVVLYCAILKKENFELVVQKATEIGVKEIVPLITERTVKLDIRKDRLEKIIKEAAEQSGRGIVPILHDPIDFEKAIDAANAGKNVKHSVSNISILFDRSGESFDKLERPDSKGQIGVWIGPEGGWTAQELELAQRSNFKIMNLGQLTLRAETAAIIGSYLAIHSF